MKRSEIQFKKGSILRKEMLEDIYDYPRVALESYYSKFSDGILYGLEWKESEKFKNHHVIMAGALKYHGNIYFMPNEIDVEELLADKIKVDSKYRLCFVEKEVQQKTATQTIYEMELKALQSEEYFNQKTQLFYYARVRCVGNDSFELFDDGEIYGLFAANDGYDYQIPYWFVKKEFIPCLEKKEAKHFFDYMILKDFYQGKGMLLSFIKMYFCEANLSFHETDFQSPVVVCEKMKEALSSFHFNMTVANSGGKSGEALDCKEEEMELGGLLL